MCCLRIVSLGTSGYLMKYDSNLRVRIRYDRKDSLLSNVATPNERGRSEVLNSLDFLSVAHLHVKQCGFLTIRRSQGSFTSDRKSSNGSVDGFTSSCYGAAGLHAGEAKPSPAVEWERTVEAAKKEGKWSSVPSAPS